MVFCSLASLEANKDTPKRDLKTWDVMSEPWGCADLWEAVRGTFLLGDCSSDLDIVLLVAAVRVDVY